MELDADHCYKAVQSRDKRFDGRFFTCVKTTGIYCRPVCPARIPKRQNVLFFVCAAAAEEAGFRPCLRCRPETSPGTPAWQGTSATVSRALRLIGEGALDVEGVDHLAARLGVGDRHLRRLFLEHLGAPPLAVAQTRRVQMAKKLLNETDLPISDVAFSAGFSSIRRFNDAMKRLYGRSPRTLRGNGKAKQIATSGHFELRLKYRPPYDWEGILAFLDARAIPGVERVAEGAYRRTLSIGGTAGLIAVRHDSATDAIVLSLPLALADSVTAIVGKVRRLFDLSADPEVIEDHLCQDPILANAIRRRPGLRVPGAWDGFETAVRAILGQQISVKGATTIAGRLAERYGTPLEDTNASSLTRVFPHAARLVHARFEGIGLTKKRIETVRTVAKAVHEDSLDLENAKSLDSFVESFTALPGIGPWTAQYTAMRTLGEPDAFPAGDLGIRKALANGGAPVPEKEVLARAEAWRPWRAYAALHLWATLSDAG